MGAGCWGQIHAGVLDRLGVLSAVCDSRREAAEECGRRHSVDHYSSLEELISLADFDAAVVCTDTAAHRAVAEELIRAGKDILMEEPAALRPSDVSCLVELAKRRSIRLSYCRILRSDPDIADLRRTILSGEMGRIVSLNIHCVRTADDEDGVLDCISRGIGGMSLILDRLPGMVFARKRDPSHRHTIVVMDSRGGPLSYLDVGDALSGQHYISISFMNGVLSAGDPATNYAASKEISAKTEASLRSEIQAFLDGTSDPLADSRDAVSIARITDAVRLSYSIGSPVYLETK